MKKTYILLVALLAMNSARTQTCLPQGIVFNWQSEIDSFQTNYPGCTAIGGNVTINAFDITNLNGLSVLTSIGGTLSIYADVLSSLSGLENLTSIGESLIIQNNDSLTSLAGLENLTSLYGLSLRFNRSLASLTGLENVISLDGMIWITDNDTLSDCAVQSICSYLTGPGFAWIENNATGCNSPDEVAEDCGVGIDENAAFGNGFRIYPNPSYATITVTASAKGTLMILNTGGQLFMSRRITEPATQIDITTLPPGVYVLKLAGNNFVEVRKLVKG